MLWIQGIEDFSITHAAKLDYAAIVAYVTEGHEAIKREPKLVSAFIGLVSHPIAPMATAVANTNRPRRPFGPRRQSVLRPDSYFAYLMIVFICTAAA